MAEKENPADYGHANRQGRIKGLKAVHATKKQVEEGKVLTAESEPKASTETPDPNVTSVGDGDGTVVGGTTGGTTTGGTTTAGRSSTSGTNTGRANTSRSGNTDTSTTRSTTTTTTTTS